MANSDLSIRKPNGIRQRLRILDACSNRASEGLRVVEDFLRFGANQHRLTAECKQLRHDLADQIAKLQPSWVARNVASDVGRRITTPQESQRASNLGTVRANLKRTQQALRSLEEWSKASNAGVATEFEQIRYRTYDLERQIEDSLGSSWTLESSWLYVLVDGGRSLAEFQARTELLLSAGVNIIQLRDKTLDDSQLLERARALSELSRQTDTRVVVNDRPDIAVIAGADGVHLGQDDLPIAAAREIMGDTLLVGQSTHTPEQAKLAIREGVDYLGVGPVFPSQTKQFDDYPGLGFVRRVSSMTNCPTFAIGGITPDNLESVKAAGIDRFAVGAAIWDAPDVAAAVHQFHDANRSSHRGNYA